LEYILGLQKKIMPERLASWKKLSVLTLFAMVLILVSEGINKEILAVWSVIFIAIVIWFFLCEKPLKILGISVNSWAMSILICLWLLKLFPGEVTSRVWISCPPLAATIAAIPEFMESKNKFKIPAPEVRQKLVILFLSYLVLGCWLNFTFTIQEWLENDPSLMQQDFSKSSFVVKVEWQKWWMEISEWIRHWFSIIKRMA